MLARRSNPSNKENSVFLPNVMTCCSEYAGKGMKGGVGGNAVWTSVDCSVIGTSAFREGSGSCGEIIDCLFVFNSICLFSKLGESIMRFVGTLNCGDPLSGDESGAE